MGCSGNVRNQVRDHLESVHSAVAAKSSDALSVVHKQYKKNSCKGYITCKAEIRLNTALQSWSGFVIGMALERKRREIEEAQKRLLRQERAREEDDLSRWTARRILSD